MIKKIFTLIIFPLLFVSFLLLEKSEVTPDDHIPLNLKPSIYISPDSKNSSLINFEIFLDGQIDIQGTFNKESKTLEAGIILENIDISDFSKHLESAYISKANLVLKKQVAYLLEGNLAIKKLKVLTKKPISAEGIILGGNLKIPVTLLNKDLKNTWMKVLQSPNFDCTLKYKINNASFDEFDKISVEGKLKEDLLTFKKSQLTYRNIPFKVEGFLKDFSIPSLEVKINGPSLSLKTKAMYDHEKKLLKIDELVAKNKDTIIIAEAIVNIQSKIAKITGQGRINPLSLNESLTAFGLSIPLTNELSPQGIIDVDFSSQTGPNLKDWGIELTAFSESFKVSNLACENIKIKFFKNKEELLLESLAATIASGELKLSAKANTSTNKASLNLNADKVNIAEVIRQLNIKKDYSGKLSLHANLENIDLFSWNKMQGQGKAIIVDGNIWQLDFLKGLGEFLFIPGFEKIIFKQGYTDFIFRNEDIIFENLKLLSKELSIVGEGKLSLKGDLDFLFYPEFTKTLVDSSEGLEKYIGAILGGTGLTVEIKGTIKNPKYKIKSPLVEPLKDIKSIFEGIFSR